MGNRNRYKTDFNDLTEDGLVTTLPGWGGSPLVPQADVAVDLFDGDGNACIGLVERVDPASALIYVRPLWDTWTDAPQSTLPLLGDALGEAMKRVVDRKQRTSTKPAPIPA